MESRTWERLKRIFRTAVPKHFDVGAAAQTPRSGPIQPETQGDSPLSSSESVQILQGAETVAVVRRPSRKRKASLSCGQIVAGRFRILRFISSGGMGEVFEAWDSDLGERVALKTIRSEIASLASVTDRFKQEVRQARGVSHVNVCRVYEVFSHVQDSGERIWFFTMELLEGQTLARRLRQQGPIPPKQALGLIEQMVAGLAAAHEHGVVHLDFKSSNVMLVDSPAGKTRAVVTDFGLALRVLTGHDTDPHEFKQGTPRYMAPEQVEGGEVGFAADQYALGVVICEMLTGDCPLRPDPASGASKAILPAGHPLNPRWEAVVRRCLELRPEDRFPNIRDVAVALNPIGRSKAPWILAGAMVLSLLLLGVMFLAWLSRTTTRLEQVAQLTASTDSSGEPSLSRNGTVVAYNSDRAEAGNDEIWLQRLPSGSPIRLTTNPAEDVDPSISPDGNSVVFRSERNGGGIYFIDATGRGERLLVPRGRDPRFSPDGRSVAYWVGDLDRTLPTAKLFLLSLADGSSVRLAQDFKDARFPVWRSDGRYILFNGCRTGGRPMPACAEWWVTNTDGTRVQNTGALALLRRQQLEPIETLGGWHGDTASFSARYGDTTSLWQLKIPASTLVATGTAQRLTARDAGNVDELSIADNGEVAFSQVSAALHVWVIKDGLSPKAIATKVTQDAAYDITPHISHNGRWLVFSRGTGTHYDIWIRDVQTGRESMLLESSQDKASPIVDDSGETVVFEAHDAQGESFLLAADQGKRARVLCSGCSQPTGWFAGERAVFYREGSPSKIKMSDLETGKTMTVLESNRVSFTEASWSPENQYLLFTVSSSGSPKGVFAVRFPKSTGVATGDWIPISKRAIAADKARWSGDGKTIFYLSSGDGSPYLWGQHFDPQAGTLRGFPFPVVHLHNPRVAQEFVAPRHFQLSVSGNSIYLNLGEVSATIWIGRLKQPRFFSFLNQSP